MKTNLKKIAASLMAVATITSGAMGISASAAEVPTAETNSYSDTASVASASKTFSFSNVTSSGYSTTNISLSTARTVNFSYGHATLGQARVAICNASNHSEVESFNIPASAGTTIYTSRYLSAGTYYFYITPINCSKTSGSFTVTY